MVSIFLWLAIVAFAFISELHWLGAAIALYGALIQFYTFTKIGNDPFWFIQERQRSGLEVPGEFHDMRDADLAAMRQEQMRSASRTKLAMCLICVGTLAFFIYRWVG